ncbi:hypothetical protein SAMN05192558_11432 [Actinokineospora alba]|uniref:Uncharacterized protein n=1 Tax=Actinokineospora alba TaxID=504798 RepID=A0A1H0VH15_9PSEU|nr:hypothetical protein [Actinokineospora alba]TDP67727.1 hypothetical protein C8E96_3277 [Actinokineospora alba]SDJ27389.1 hypothetical protein SAMN05421871_11232 [Actinokineospora alba]SDP77842.1 hypothetical protein SAMN05192558_11432 [Actinokineospora alba]
MSPLARLNAYLSEQRDRRAARRVARRSLRGLAVSPDPLHRHHLLGQLAAALRMTADFGAAHVLELLRRSEAQLAWEERSSASDDPLAGDPAVAEVLDALATTAGAEARARLVLALHEAAAPWIAAHVRRGDILLDVAAAYRRLASGQ